MRKDSLASRAISVAAAAILVSCLMVSTAFANVDYDDNLGYWYDDDRNLILDDDVMDDGELDETLDDALLGSATVDSRPTAAATRAAMSCVEMMGLVSVEEQGAFSTILNMGTYFQPVFSWAQPKYMLFATGLSSQPSPYLVNFAAHTGSNMAVYNPSREGGGAGPNAILAQAGVDATDDDVWAMNPDVIIGDGGKSASVLDTWNSGYDHNDYVKYSVSDYTAMMQTASDIATAANNSGVTANVNAFNTYINSQHNSVSGSVALVLDYDSNTQLYEIGSSYAPSGTATTNRYLEAALWGGLQNINTNTTSASTYESATTLRGVSLILVGGQQGSSNYTAIMNQLYADQLLENAYFVKDDNTHAGAPYGYVMNSFDNAQNLARILPKFSNTTGAQRAAVESFFVNFYHINNNTSDLDVVIGNTINGYVRNWDVAPDYNLSLADNIANMTAW